MITVTALREKSVPVGFEITGHAMHGEYGEDLVCAAVSAIIQTAILGITDVLKLKAGCSLAEGNAICILDRDTVAEDKDRASIVFETMLTGLRSIQAAYPKTLKFRSKEV